MTDERKIPAQEREIEINISNSRFIASLKPTFSVEEAKSFIQEIQSKYPDATHHVPVYIIGHPPSTTEHCSDDGEPSGTAGKPALAVLRGNGFGDITIVVTRYFGGTKLGTGGLVRAYSDSIRTAIENLKIAVKVETITTTITIPYPIYEQSQRIIQQHSGQIIDQIFEADVTLSLQFLSKEFESFRNAIIELTRGQVEPQIESTNPNSIFPIS